jgi:hypothetical protein
MPSITPWLNNRHSTDVTVMSIPHAGNACLRTLSYAVDGGTVIKMLNFSSFVLACNVMLPFGTDPAAEITMVPEAAMPGASIEASGIRLSGGSGTAVIRVVSPDGSTTNTYSITFTISTKPGSFRVGSVQYATLEDAVAAVPDKGTITMLHDVALGAIAYLDVNKAYTLDLGGHSLTNEGSFLYLLRIEEGEVSIKNGRAVNTSGTSPILVFMRGTLYIIDGEYIGYYNALYVIGGTAVITSGHFVCTNNPSRFGCMNASEGKIILAPGSVANVTQWLNNPDVSDMTVTAGEPAVKCGDVDGDDKITAYDATLVLQHVVGMITLEGRALEAADTDHDGKITSYDATLILQYVVGMITSFD